MKEAAPSCGVVRFSGFEVDLRNGEVRKHGSKLRLQDQPFHVLQILLDHPGELVTREELQRRIWPADTFVDFEKGLNNAIKRLRDALGDSAEHPRFIETHARHGYRFIGSVTATNGGGRKEEAASAAGVSVPALSRPLYRRLAIGAVLLLAFVATLFGLDIGGVRQRWLIKSSSPVIHSLAVLPLTNLSGDPTQEYFSDGMTDALITNLAQIASVKVISRTSSMQYKQTKKSLPGIARELGVDGIVEGTVQRSGDHVRITAQLIQTPSDKHLWANTYEGDLHDTFALERDITEDIVRHVQERITPAKATQIAQPKRVDAKVLEAFLQGNYYLERFGNGGGDEEKRKAGEYLQQAIDADPSFAPAYLGLAKAHLWLLWPSDQDAQIAKKAAERALALDPDLSDAHATLGDINVASWKWQAGEEEYRRAIAINPNNADAHGRLGSLLLMLGRLDEGYRECQIAQTLDPGHDQFSDALERQGQFDRTIDMELMLLKRYPNDGQLHWELFRLYLKKGMYKEASFHMDQTAILVGFPQIAADSRRAQATSGYLGAIRAGLKDCEHLVTTHQAFIPVNMAEIYAALGDKDRAFYWLEQAYAQHDLAIASTDLHLERINMEYLLESLRSDPRFKDLLRRIGLPP